jgi:hypothetical protein
VNSKQFEFENPQEVEMLGYTDHIMEPFLSRDGELLFFNNLNQQHVNTDLHFATRINDSVFQYKGPVKGANSDFLDGVPSMDGSNNMYFVSTRSYEQTLSTIYSGIFSTDTLTDIHLVAGISKNSPGWVNFDIEVSEDGKIIYTVDGLFDENGGPYESDLLMAVRKYNIFERSDDVMLELVNTEALEYAACISSDMLELYFTRLTLPLSQSSLPQIFVATRASDDEAFRKPYRIKEISGFAEAPTISPDSKIIYYHKNENEVHKLYMIRKKY